MLEAAHTSALMRVYIFESASRLYLLCSQVLITAPSSSLTNVPLSMLNRLPAWTI